MLTLWQAEWCPYSSRVRQVLTELGLDYVARQVAADPDDRDEMRAATGGKQSIPLLVLEDGTQLEDAREIITYLRRTYEPRPDARRHREKYVHEAPDRDPRGGVHVEGD